MSNKQEATWHDGKECPGTPRRGHTRMAATEPWDVCPGGIDARVDRDHSGEEVVLRHQDGSFCGHKVQPRMAVTEDPTFGAATPWEPQARPGQAVSDLGLDEWVGQALGAAAGCWSNLPEAGAFDSTRCTAISEALMAHFSGIIAAFVREAENRRELQARYIMSLEKESNGEPHLKYDDKTLEKVRAALHYILGGNIKDQRLTDCIAEMQNQGVLFRERDAGVRPNQEEKESYLGRATTRSLLEEIEVRLRDSKPSAWFEEQIVKDMMVTLPKETLDYRTADGE